MNDLPESILPVITDIFREVQATQYGDVNLTITTHKGMPVGLVINSFRHERFIPGETSRAFERVLSIAKKMVDTKETGTLSFTLVFNQGEVKEVTHQFYDKKSY